jgi:hypothetical protein
MILALLTSPFCRPAVAEPITMSPKRVSAGTSATLTITTSPFFINLAQLNPPQLQGYRIFVSISRRNFSSHPARLSLARMEALELG